MADYCPNTGSRCAAAGIIALVAIIYIGKIIEMSKGHPDPGITTEVALLLMFAVGAYLVVGDRAAAIAIGGGAAVLLHFKGELHGIVARLGANDLKAIMQNAGRLNAEDGWRLVVVAAISNLIFKAGVVAALGRRRLFVRILPAYGIAIAAGILMLLYRYFAF